MPVRLKILSLPHLDSLVAARALANTCFLKRLIFQLSCHRTNFLQSMTHRWDIDVFVANVFCKPYQFSYWIKAERCSRIFCGHWFSSTVTSQHSKASVFVMDFGRVGKLQLWICMIQPLGSAGKLISKRLPKKFLCYSGDLTTYALNESRKRENESMPTFFLIQEWYPDKEFIPAFLHSFSQFWSFCGTGSSRFSSRILVTFDLAAEHAEQMSQTSLQVFVKWVILDRDQKISITHRRSIYGLSMVLLKSWFSVLPSVR